MHCGPALLKCSVLFPRWIFETFHLASCFNSSNKEKQTIRSSIIFKMFILLRHLGSIGDIAHSYFGTDKTIRVIGFVALLHQAYVDLHLIRHWETFEDVFYVCFFFHRWILTCRLETLTQKLCIVRMLGHYFYCVHYRQPASQPWPSSSSASWPITSGCWWRACTCRPCWPWRLSLRGSTSGGTS